MIAAKISRRTSLRRVVATGESSPPATATLSRSPRRDRARSTSRAPTNASTTSGHRVDLLAVVVGERGRVQIDALHGD